MEQELTSLENARLASKLISSITLILLATKFHLFVTKMKNAMDIIVFQAAAEQMNNVLTVGKLALMAIV